MSGFSDTERERVREDLLSAGRELFARHGLAKTTVAELTDRAGIADGTFYRFFDSKTALYVAVLEREGERVLPRILAPLSERDDPEAALVGFLTELMDEIETNPLIRPLMVDSDELDRLRDHHSPAEAEQNRQESVAYFLPHVREWYEAGAIRGPDPETVAHAIRAVSMLSLHQEDVGEERYRETRDVVIRAVARGLTATE
ncbi:TetR/AcrR family transcriptional regulator [Halostella salina]|uniref:TetR/AcrR family transcriptional regulator n=1 Tax=Halostella salina TaxID=1547897 RepID=UPI000EF792ED|nr:TetR/AcrR family transcriptional regulator [Halostella salina]